MFFNHYSTQDMRRISSRQLLAMSFLIMGLAASQGMAQTTQPFVPTPSASPQLNASASAVDFQEDSAAYMIRMTLPHGEADKVNLRMHGNILNLSIPQPGGGSYAQSYHLPNADLTKSPGLKREGDTVEISIPKVAQHQVAQAAPAKSQQSGLQDEGDASTQVLPRAMNRQIMSQFAQMERQARRIFNQTMRDMDASDDSTLAGMFPGMLGAQGNSDNTLSLEEKPDCFIVHAKIPGDDIKNVKVSVDNGNILKITGQMNPANLHLDSRAASHQASPNT